jgi:hypothetical protein
MLPNFLLRWRFPAEASPRLEGFQSLGTKLWHWLAMAALGLPVWGFAAMAWQRPPQTNEARSLFRGITYQRQFLSTQRPVMLHIVRVNLMAHGVKAFVTPGQRAPDDTETNARTTSEFVREFNLQLGINANFFFPFDESTAWNYYPYSGDRANAIGQAISNGTIYSPANPDWPVLCFATNQRAQILASGECPPDTMQAVAGSQIVVQNGAIIPAKSGGADSDGIYSRTAVGIDKTGQTLWILAVDDKQWLYSEGVTLEELGKIAIQQGADTVLNLDGGGSTTMVIGTSEGTQVLNAPVHTKIPMRERPVANHLGFYADR